MSTTVLKLSRSRKTTEKGLPRLRSLGNEAVQFVDEVAGVVKARHLIDKGAGLQLLQVADVVHGDGHVVRQDGQLGQVFFPEKLFRPPR